MNTEQLKQLEEDLWSAADNLRANSDLKSSEYAAPVFGAGFSPKIKFIAGIHGPE